MSEPFDLSSLVGEFRDEASQQIDLLERSLDGIARGAGLPEELGTELLRALHTLKGNSALLGLGDVRDFVHGIEGWLKALPDAPEPSSAEPLLRALAPLRRAVRAAGTDEEREAAAALAAAARAVPAPGTMVPAPGAAAGMPPAPRSPTQRAGEAGPAPGDDATARDSLGVGEFLRVPFAAVDTLLDQVGELTGLADALEELLRRERDGLRDADLLAPLEERARTLRRLSTLLRGTVLELRLVPARRLLGRFPGLARQLADERGKRVRVVLQGEGTQLDKSTMEALAEPLVHLVRNAIDHGIETPAEREAAGKPPEGTLTLAAEAEGGQITILVADDGRGLDREAILRRAAELGIAPDTASAPADEVLELVFEPGFSSRKRADAVSGRGIGLDVVRASVARLRGRVEVDSRPGAGATFRLTLPLRIAIVPAVTFRAGGQRLALAVDQIMETVRAPEVARVGDAAAIRHRGELVPLADPRRLFQDGDAGDDAGPPPFALVVRGGGGRRAAVRADALLERKDAVVKHLPGYVGEPAAVAGVTVDAEGRAVLLLDAAGLVALNRELHRRSSRAG